MGVRAGVVVCATSFLIGALFTHWIADSLTLWKSPVTDEHLWTAASYYTVLAKFPNALAYVLTAIVALGGTTILWSLRDGEAGNIMFDGGSIFLFTTTIVMYSYYVIPSILSKFSSLPVHEFNSPTPRFLRIATLDLASNNLICSVALTGVLALQAGRAWAERIDDDDDVTLVQEDSSKSRARTPGPGSGSAEMTAESSS